MYLTKQIPFARQASQLFLKFDFQNILLATSSLLARYLDTVLLYSPSRELSSVPSDIL
jgi:hypothetical protein